ncbi:Ig-like domain-containing protein, partial [Flavobacterium gawalongense]
MKSIFTYSTKLFLLQLLCLLSLTNGFSQFVPDGNYYSPTDEYLNAQSKIVDPNASSTCEVERVFALTGGTDTDQYLLLGINNGNGGSAIFRYYINTDGLATGLANETYKGTVYPIGGAEIVIQIDASKNELMLFEWNDLSGELDIVTIAGIASEIGSYNPGDNSFIEIKIPLSIFNPCNSTTGGIITLAKYLSFSGGSINSNPCALEDIDFIIGLNGIVTPDAEYCSGQDTETHLILTGQLGDVVRWESSTDDFNTAGTPIINTNGITVYDTPSNLSATTYFRAVISSTLCPNNTLNSTSAEIKINPGPTISGTFSVCESSTTQLAGSGTPAALNPWVSSDPSKATVSSTGLVTGVSAG